jgi:hypothetical protein
MQMMDGKWIDQAKQSYEYNKARGNTVRIVYTTPPAQPAPVPLTPKQIAHFVGVPALRSNELRWFRFGEAAHGITKGQP